MSYNTATITSATPATDLMNALDTLLIAHPAWDFVEEVLSGAIVARVYKCLGTVNGLGSDFYLMIRRSSSTSNINLYLSEAYDTGTHIASKLAAWKAAATLSNSDGTLPFTLQPATLAVTNGPTLADVVVNVNTTGFVYWVSIQNDCFVLVTSGGNPAYVGVYTNINPLVVQPAPHLLATTLGGSAQGAVTRDIPSTTLAYLNYLAAMISSFINESITGKDSINNKWVATPIKVNVLGPAARPLGSVSGVRGYIPVSKIKRMDMSEFAETWGDTVTIDGEVHTCIFTGSGQSVWVSQAA